MSLNIDTSAVKRIKELRTQQGKNSLKLRITVDSGGCSGFQYKLDLTENIDKQDMIFADSVITDSLSLGFLRGATIKFEQNLIGSEFKIDNPNAISGCGCGTSFSIDSKPSK